MKIIIGFYNIPLKPKEVKFGAIADSIDPNSYDQLSAAFADLSKVVLNLVTKFTTVGVPNHLLIKRN